MVESGVDVYDGYYRARQPLSISYTSTTAWPKREYNNNHTHAHVRANLMMLACYRAIWRARNEIYIIDRLSRNIRMLTASLP